MLLIQQEFDNYYRGIFGERWEALRAALLQPERQVRRANTLAMANVVPADSSIPRTNVSSMANSSGHSNAEQSPHSDCLSWLPQCVWHTPVEQIPRADSDLLLYYVMDPASVLVAENLGVKPGDRVLDMCAAPGGKSLVLAQVLFSKPADSSELILNELSADRRHRLIKIVQQYLPRQIREQVWVKGKDGVRFGLEMPDTFDAILLDAPCSGERHLMGNPKELADWRPQRTKGLAQKQYSLLSSAWLALRQGGRLMYSTCALSPLENDGVIEKLLKKKTDAVVLKQSLLGPKFEETQFGRVYAPDRSGFGPMYSCLLTKE